MTIDSDPRGADTERQDTMRIWHQSMAEIERLDSYGTTMERHAKNVCSPDTEISVRGLPLGTYGDREPSDALGYPILYRRAADHVLDNARRAEDEGYDAFVVGSFSDPVVRELRSSVDIPVVSVAEASILVAHSLGRYLALIANAPQIARIVRSHVDADRLGSRVEVITSVAPPRMESDLAAALHAPDSLVEDFLAAARSAVARGVDVVVPSEIVMNEVLWSHGITQVDGAVIVDSLAIAWRYAEMLVRLWSTSALRVGRAWEFARLGREGTV